MLASHDPEKQRPRQNREEPEPRKGAKTRGFLKLKEYHITSVIGLVHTHGRAQTKKKSKGGST